MSYIRHRTYFSLLFIALYQLSSLCVASDVVYNMTWEFVGSNGEVPIAVVGKNDVFYMNVYASVEVVDNSTTPPTISPATFLSVVFDAETTSAGLEFIEDGEYFSDTSVLAKSPLQFLLNRLTGIGGITQVPGAAVGPIPVASLPTYPRLVISIPVRAADYGNMTTALSIAETDSPFPPHSTFTVPTEGSISSNYAPDFNPADGNNALFVALPGDADLDGDVDFTDFVALNNNMNADPNALHDSALLMGWRSRWNRGDFNGDGLVNFDDFVILNNHWGQTANYP